MNWLESKYINILSSRLRNFKRKTGTLYNFACPLCNDSSKDSRKARGYIYVKSGSYRYHCHNGCGTMSIPTFLKRVDEFLYNDFIIEKVLERKALEPDPILDYKKPTFIKTTALNDIKKISQLKHDHFARLYVDSRQIPTNQHHRLFYAPKFMSWVNTFIPGKFNERALHYDSAALVIPFVNKDGRLHALQGRYFEGDVRYVTIITDESIPKIWGLDQYDRDSRGYVFEGPIDAMFIKNSVATAGGTELSTLKFLNTDNIVICFDNEPRSKDTVKKIEKSIASGMSVCIWPTDLPYKDVNDMIKDGGISADGVRDIIDKNTFKGLTATLQLNNWKKI